MKPFERVRNEKEYRSQMHFDNQKTFAASNSFARLEGTNVLFSAC